MAREQAKPAVGGLLAARPAAATHGVLSSPAGCDDCRVGDHTRCVGCDCEVCAMAEAELSGWGWFPTAVGQWLEAAYRQPTSDDDRDELRDEAEWLKAVERGDYGD